MQENRRAIWSWAFIDWANSAFAIVMLTALFPIFFKQYFCAGMPPEQSTFYWGLANTLSSVAIAVLAPILGSIADQGNAKKKFLFGFTLLGCLATALIPLLAKGDTVLAAALYAIGAFGFSGNNMFSDALLTDVADTKNYDRVSALGYALGYIGSGGLFVFCAAMISSPENFGLADTVAATNTSFILTAAWWMLFTIPCLLWVRETPGTPAVGGGESSALTRGFRQFAATFREIRSDRRLLFFLAGYVLYIDGVNTVIKMATDFGLSIGLDQAGLIKALLVTQFVAFPAAILFGRIGEKFGARRGIMLGVAVYAGLCVFATRMTTQAEFFAMAVTVGLVQGGVQSLSRSYFARLIPAEKGGEYFGFYNMVGKFAAILGPTLMGVSALLVGSRLSILSLLLLFGGGLWLLAQVREEAPAA
ncbi:MAG: MFS transporter [Opitutaceae bacterium]|nr:MFS transporter [Opitutaceae bacterium]